MKRLPRYGLLSILLFISLCSGAQNLLSILASQRNALVASQLSYKYTVQMVQYGSNQLIDQVAGHLYRHADSLLDSNADYCMMLNRNWYCKIDHRVKSVSVYNLSTVERKTHMKRHPLSSGVLNVVDSFPLIPSTLFVDTSNADHYLVRCQLIAPRTTYLTVLLQKRTYRLSELIITSLDYQDSKPAYKNIYRIYDIENSTNHTPISSDWIYRLEESKVVLADKYRDYTIHALIN